MDDSGLQYISKSAGKDCTRTLQEGWNTILPRVVLMMTAVDHYLTQKAKRCSVGWRSDNGKGHSKFFTSFSNPLCPLDGGKSYNGNTRLRRHALISKHFMLESSFAMRGVDSAHWCTANMKNALICD